ncbi:MAG TPA: PilZ domain-containing protein [Terracidiphilus sp.]|nr:PilZ domain-containing protein [Terracidiphilus sp.]
MACGTLWDHESKAPEIIAGNRRSDRRYPLRLDLRWKLIRRRRVLETGVGSTLDLSKGGVRFESNRPLPEGFNVELAINWPALLHNVAPMQLVVLGRIMRSEDGQIAIRTMQHEFRTVGAPANHCDAPSKAALPFLTPVNRAASLQ